MNKYRKKVADIFPSYVYKHHFTAFSALVFLVIGILISPEHFTMTPPDFTLPLLTFAAILLARKSTIPFILLGIILTGSQRGEFEKHINYFESQGNTDYAISFYKAPQYEQTGYFTQIVRIRNQNYRGLVKGAFTRPIIPGEQINVKGSVTSVKECSLPWNHDKQKSLYINCHGIFELSSELPPVSSNWQIDTYSKITQFFDSFEVQTRAMLYALFLANRSYLSRGIKDLFHTGGVSHLLALSGLHIATIIFILNLLLNRLPLNKTVRLSLLILIPWSITLFTGFSPSIVRALVMSTFLLGSFLVKRPSNSINSLGAAGIFLLLHSPFQLYTPGFLLSFSAVLGILIAIKRVKTLDFSYKKRKFFTFIVVPISAALSTTPITLLFFRETCPGGIISNLIITPLFSIYFTATSLLLIVGTFFSKISIAVEKLTDLFISLLLAVVNQFNISTTSIQINDITVFLITLSLITLLFTHVKYRHTLLLYTLLIFLTVSLFTKPQSYKGCSEITKFNTNKSCISIEYLTNTPSRKSIKWLCNNSKNRELIVKIPNLNRPDFLRVLYMNSEFRKIYIYSSVENRTFSSNKLFTFLDTNDTLYLENQIVIP